MLKPKILISILNWNKAVQTLACVASVISEISLTTADVTILVIDNGSNSDDVAILNAENLKTLFSLHVLPTNLGFTGGHNVAIQMAIDKNFNFIWLLNNDATVERGTLPKLVEAIQADVRCGAISPIIRTSDDKQIITACVQTHNWVSRQSERFTLIDEAKRVQAERIDEVWQVGTAILFRITALKEVGLLDDKLFAYFDDNDIGVRLANAGWTSACAFNASVYHETRDRKSHPLYVYYLFQRNEMMFWQKHMPSKQRRFLWLKLIDTGLFDVNRLYRLGLKPQGDAALLGVSDFVQGKFGPPELNRKPLLLLRFLCRVSGKLNEHKYITHVDKILIPEKSN
jgi:GT2 family glycosyltransferase